MNNLGYSYTINERNSEKLYSLNKSIESLMESNDILKQFESIEFEIEGNIEDKSLKLVVYYKTKDGKEGQELFSSHIDEGAIEVSETIIQAYFGIDKYNEIKETLNEYHGIFEADYLKSKEPELYNQLAEEYLLQCSPDVDNGAEFTDQDEKFFEEILKKNMILTLSSKREWHKDGIGSEPLIKDMTELKDWNFEDISKLYNETMPYDTKVELNEYIEKMSEIKPLLNQICENINNKRVLVVNDGCDEYLVRKVVGYLENHGIIVQFN